MPEGTRLDQLMNFEFVTHCLAPCGRAVVLVANAPTETFWKAPRYGRDLGDLLIRANLGRYEGSKYHPGIWHLFTVDAKQIEKAVELIRDGIRVRGLMESSRLAIADIETQQWKALN